jgi:uncharacterized protein DUF4287
MTRQKSFKRRVRARMEKTHESYTAARNQLLAKSDAHAEDEAAEVKPAAADSGVDPIKWSDEAIVNNTGKNWSEWFALLDAWGGVDRKHGEIARWLSEEHSVSGWWAQSITVGFEQARGIRAPGQGSDGWFSISASKTVNVPAERLFEAFADERLRDQWLPGAKMEVTTASPTKSFRARWGDDGSRIAVGFVPKGEAKSVVGLAHEKLATAEDAKAAKAFWSEQMKALKQLLES